jgi:hypothetical protein
MHPGNGKYVRRELRMVTLLSLASAKACIAALWVNGHHRRPAKAAAPAITQRTAITITRIVRRRECSGDLCVPVLPAVGWTALGVKADDILVLTNLIALYSCRFVPMTSIRLSSFPQVQSIRLRCPFKSRKKGLLVAALLSNDSCYFLLTRLADHLDICDRQVTVLGVAFLHSTVLRGFFGIFFHVVHFLV